jgi:hypothetical protein
MTEPGYLLKFSRAIHHFEDLERQLTEWFEEHYSHRLDPDPEAEGYFLLKASADDLDSAPFALILGDAIQNFRSCLDHLAFQLASTFTKPLSEPMARSCQFPIIGDVDRSGQGGRGPKLFKDESRRIAGIDPGAQRIIEGLQPYQRGEDFTFDPLWRLQELSNVDKHRVLHLATVYCGGFVSHPDQCINVAWPSVGGLQVFGGTVKRDTVIARLHLRPINPAREMHMDIVPSPATALTDGCAADRDILLVLSGIRTHFITQVFPALRSYL